MLEDVCIERLQPVKIKTDTFYDAITVRIWAGMKDYTIARRGTTGCGSVPCYLSSARTGQEVETLFRRLAEMVIA